VPDYRRRLPHVFKTDKPVFLTCRLHGSLPSNRYFRPGTLTAGQQFVAMDRILDAGRTGPLYMKDARIADLVVDAIQHAEESLKHFELHAYVVMPNHVHMLVTPRTSLPLLLKSLKSITAKRGNELLGLTGTPFWQDESYDRNVRNREEFARIRRYIEMNPVNAGLARSAEEYEWSSARTAIGGSPADQGVRPPLLKKLRG